MQYHGVELMALDGALDAVGDDFAAGERIVHAFVVHGDAVADADGVHLHRSAARHADACLHGIGDGLEMHVSGNDFVLGGNDRDERAVEFFVGQAVGLEKAAVRRTRKAFLDGIASMVHRMSRFPSSV